MQTQRNTNTTHVNDSAIRDVLFSPRGVKRQRRETLANATTTTTTTTIQTQTDPTTEGKEQEQEQEYTCAICMDATPNTKNVSVTECGHRFCTSCLLKSLQTNNRCPICRAEIEPARKPNLEQLTASIAADLIQAEERDIDIHRRIALIGAFSDARGRSDMILSLCREFAFGVAHSIAGWQGTDDQTYHSSWIDYEYNNYQDDDDSDDDNDSENDEDGSDDGSDGDDNDNDDDNNDDDNNDGTEKRDEVNPPPSWNEAFPATSQSATSQSATQPCSTRTLIYNVISGVVSYTMLYTFYYALPNLVSSLVDTIVQNIRQE